MKQCDPPLSLLCSTDTLIQTFTLLQNTVLSRYVVAVIVRFEKSAIMLLLSPSPGRTDPGWISPENYIAGLLRMN